MTALSASRHRHLGLPDSVRACLFDPRPFLPSRHVDLPEGAVRGEPEPDTFPAELR